MRKNKSLLSFLIKDLIMNLRSSIFSILNKEKNNYIKGVYKRRIKVLIESYKDTQDEGKRNIIYVQDVLVLDIVSI